ncbi:class I SAM-dependent methyltransferase [Pontibacter sp. G13]|uniref:class I SAM-dependent methyltransferase n=1 Tax=Pontibacter sp. G13 TaxID=3074898 RepID=UPI002889E8AD|nr:class I SAM-dependent methyltransferase [Pontibacter sp. G13]WNJ17698.1 class I SAM-dependent methyltransferase [Pontibacter sp. G13]
MDKHRKAIDLFNRKASEYQAKYMDVSAYHESLDIFCESIERVYADVLELACGPGNVTKYLLDKRPNWQILATDLAPQMLELAQINNPQAETELMDIRSLTYLHRKFDGVICSFGLPYLSQEEAAQLVNDAVQVLHSDGVLYLSTMSGAYDRSGWEQPSDGGPDQMYIHYHERDYLVNCMKEAGFSMIYESAKPLESSDLVDLMLIGKLGTELP